MRAARKSPGRLGGSILDASDVAVGDLPARRRLERWAYDMRISIAKVMLAKADAEDEPEAPNGTQGGCEQCQRTNVKASDRHCDDCRRAKVYGWRRVRSDDAAGAMTLAYSPQRALPSSSAAL